MNAVVDNMYKGLIFKSDIHKEINVGDRLKGYVKNVRKDGKIDLRLEPIGYKDSIEKTADIILSAINENEGLLAEDYTSDIVVYTQAGSSTGTASVLNGVTVAAS